MSSHDYKSMLRSAFRRLNGSRTAAAVLQHARHFNLMVNAVTGESEECQIVFAVITFVALNAGFGVIAGPGVPLATGVYASILLWLGFCSNRINGDTVAISIVGTLVIAALVAVMELVACLLSGDHAGIQPFAQTALLTYIVLPVLSMFYSMSCVEGALGGIAEIAGFGFNADGSIEVLLPALPARNR